MTRPVLFVTNYAPAFRVGAFARLHEREDVVFALVGGRMRHGGAAPERSLPFPVLRPTQRHVARLAGSGRFRAVIAGLSGRVALPAAYAGARAAGVPFVLWATIWRHPRTAAHALSYLPLRHLYRNADAVVTYGPHVSAYVRAKGARATVVEAPQSVDGAFWEAPATARPAGGLPGPLRRPPGAREGRGDAARGVGADGAAPAARGARHGRRRPAARGRRGRRRAGRGRPARPRGAARGLRRLGRRRRSRASPRATSSSRGGSW